MNIRGNGTSEFSRREALAAAAALAWTFAARAEDAPSSPLPLHTTGLEHIGLTVPDPDLRWNAETQHYAFGAIDWSEFYEVIKGNGPCNRERLAARRKAWEDGAWVRDAAIAHAEKRAHKAA